MDVGRLKRVGAFIRRRPVLTALLLAVAGFSLTPAIILHRSFFIPHPDKLPSKQPEPALPDIQTEPHTCGLHTLNVLYRAYGLDPDSENLRARLGVDIKALFWLRDSTGALHPDLFMVMEQDGFGVREIRLGEPDAWDRMVRHTENGHWLALLIRRRENGNLHWVAARAGSADQLWILDSLAEEPYPENRDFMNHHVVTALAVSPSGEFRPGFRESIGNLWRGSSSQTRAATRIAKLKKQ